MREFTVDFRGVKTYNQFYEALIKGLAFPDWCGNNPDAIWDLLTGWMDDPAKVTVIGIDRLPKDLVNEATLIKNVFRRTTNWYKDINAQFLLEYIE